MSTEELAYKGLAEWREKEAKLQLDWITKTELEMVSMPKKIVFKDHKGEMVIEESDYGLGHHTIPSVLFTEMIPIEKSHKRDVGTVVSCQKSSELGTNSKRHSELDEKMVHGNQKSVPRPSLPCVVGFDQPSTSGQTIIYASQLTSNKKQISRTSNAYLPKKPAHTYLIDREAAFHQEGCNKLPADCRCIFVSWIWAQIPEAVVNPVRGGKWIFFCKRQNVNEIWKKVTTLLAGNQLGNGAKIANGETENHLIYLFTYDFKDVRDVFRVLLSIRRNHLSGGYLYYKTEKATDQGLYTSDQAAQSAGFGKPHPDEKLLMYSSPRPLSSNPKGTEQDLVQLFLNEPDNKMGLLAETFRKDLGDVDFKVVFYNPPQMMPHASFCGPVERSRVGHNENKQKRTKQVSFEI